MEETDLIVMWGSNARETHPIFFHHVLKALRRGAKLICVDPRRTRTAELSDLHVPVIPGTDLLLLNAMAQVISEEGLYDRPFLEEHLRFVDGEKTVSFEDFRAFLDKFPKSRLAGECLGF